MPILYAAFIALCPASGTLQRLHTLLFACDRKHRALFRGVAILGALSIEKRQYN